MTMNLKIASNIALVGALLLTLGTSVRAEVYKWVDKDGKVHYSDQPPLSGEGKKMKRKTTDTPAAAAPAPSANTSAKPAATAADQELEYRKRKAEKEELEKKQQTEADAAQKNKEYCNNLKGELRSHGDGTRLVRHNDKGERIFLDDKERAESKQRLEERIAKECK
jgi:Domain of unknown function (DUF4124)